MEPRRTLPKLTDRLPLRDGLEVSPFCLGAIGDPDVVSAAFEAGINFFFITADMHWPMYESVREGLRRLLRANPRARDTITVGVVAYVTQPEFCWVPFDEVLAELPELQNRIDVTIAGGVYGHEFPTRVAIYKQHRQRKHVGARAIGASFHDRVCARAALEAGDLDVAFIRYNPLHPGAARDLFPHVTETQPLLFNFKSTNGLLQDHHYAKFGIDESFWRPHATDYYRFVLTEPALDGVLCSLSKVSEVRDLVDALAKGPLDDEDRDYMLQLGELARGDAKVAAVSD